MATAVCPNGHTNTRAYYKCAKGHPEYWKDDPEVGADGIPMPEPCPGKNCGTKNPATKLVCKNCSSIVNY